MMTTANIDLPSVGKAAQQAEKPLEVMIRPDRTLALRDLARDGKERDVSRKELSAAILEAQARNPEQPVLISGDKNVKYEAVLEIMDELQRQQVKRVALNVQVSGK
jgi:biopolymer transport protein TolR